MSKTQNAPDLSDQIAAELPYLRRYARALTGAQSSGDRYAVATLSLAAGGLAALMAAGDIRLETLLGSQVRDPDHPVVALNAAAQYAGLSVGVSAGADVSKITRALALTLVPILAGNLTAAGIAGPTMPQLALGLSLGTSGLLLTGVGVGGVVPVAPAPAPGVGTSISIVF